nr:hypothetical protein [Tanacetum cinerariifolium]
FRSTSTTRRRLRKPFTSSASAHVSENIPAGASVTAAATTIPAGSSKAQAERVASPTEHGPGMSDQRRRELDAAQLIYTEADWLELLLMMRMSLISGVIKTAGAFAAGDYILVHKFMCWRRWMDG